MTWRFSKSRNSAAALAVLRVVLTILLSKLIHALFTGVIVFLPSQFRRGDQQ